MNFSNILNKIAETDPEVFEKTSQRRSAIRTFTKGVALTAIPFAVGSLFKKAYGQSTTMIIDTLNFALTLEYLEAEFYTTAYASPGLIPVGPPDAAIKIIRDHEIAHVAFLTTAIQGLQGTPVTKPTFDFTGGQGSGTGPFMGAFSSYGLFLAVAQVFEDTGVRAYKGQAGNLMSNNDILTAALNIHSIEARHASHIRQMRKATGLLVDGDPKPWITGNQSNIVNNPGSAAIQKSYNGEELAIQGAAPGVTITNIGGFAIGVDDATEAFDEILTKEQILDIVAPFIVP